MELGRLQKTKSSFDAAQVQIVAIATDAPEHLQKARNSIGGQFMFLSDEDRSLVDLFGIRHVAGGPGGEDIAQSASFLLDDEGRIRWSYATPNYRIRKHPAAVLAEIRQVMQTP